MIIRINKVNGDTYVSSNKDGTIHQVTAFDYFPDVVLHALPNNGDVAYYEATIDGTGTLSFGDGATEEDFLGVDPGFKP